MSVKNLRDIVKVPIFPLSVNTLEADIASSATALHLAAISFSAKEELYTHSYSWVDWDASRLLQTSVMKDKCTKHFATLVL